MDGHTDDNGPLCPSAQPGMDGAVILGVVGGTAREPRLAHLVEPRPVTQELLLMTEPVPPTQVFRFAAPCAAAACVHFSAGKCRLASRVVDMLPEVTDGLPICRIRPVCRWWQQEGKAACLRCPQVVTEVVRPTDLQVEAADPTVYPEYTEAAGG